MEGVFVHHDYGHVLSRFCSRKIRRMRSGRGSVIYTGSGICEME